MGLSLKIQESALPKAMQSAIDHKFGQLGNKARGKYTVKMSLDEEILPRD